MLLFEVTRTFGFEVMVNLSYTSSHEAIVGLWNLKKIYRPVSNLAFVSKIIEKSCVSSDRHLPSNFLYPCFQSAYRKHYGTETALFRVQNEFLLPLTP